MPPSPLFSGLISSLIFSIPFLLSDISSSHGCSSYFLCCSQADCHLGVMSTINPDHIHLSFSAFIMRTSFLRPRFLLMLVLLSLGDKNIIPRVKEHVFPLERKWSIIKDSSFTPMGCNKNSLSFDFSQLNKKKANYCITFYRIKMRNSHSQGLAGRPPCPAEPLGASAARRRYIRCRRQAATRPDPGSRLSTWDLGSGSCPGALAWSTPRTWALP